MEEILKENNQQQNILKKSWKRHFTPKNIIINGLITLLPASLIIGILRELGIGGALIITSIIFGLMYLAGEIREKVVRLIKNRKQF